MKNLIKDNALELALIALLLFMCFAAKGQEVNITNAIPNNPTLSGGLQQIYDAATS